ncbi:PTS transporter subunit EIIB, partial [Actinomyces denticolens]
MSQARQIVDALGGFDNIAEIEPCITRLRCELEDVSAVDKAALKAAGAHG